MSDQYFEVELEYERGLITGFKTCYVHAESHEQAKQLAIDKHRSLGILNATVFKLNNISDE